LISEWLAATCPTKKEESKDKFPVKSFGYKFSVTSFQIYPF